MKKTISLFLSLCATCSLCLAQTSAQWKFDTGKAGQKATFGTGQSSTLSADSVFAADYVKLHGLYFTGKTYTYGGVTLSKVQPYEQSSTASSGSMVEFILIPRSGVTFTPTGVSFYCSRHGTSGGMVDVAMQAGDGAVKSLKTSVKPERDATTFTDLTMSGVESTSATPLHLYLYLYTLGNTKQVSFGIIAIEGTATGAATGVEYLNFNVVSEPEGAVSLVQDPEGTQFVAHTPVTVTATANEGFRFLCWRDEAGNELSRTKTYDLDLTAHTTITAHCRQLPNMDRGCYDFVVPDDGTVKDAIEAANARKDTGKRYIIYIRRGDHQMPASDTETAKGSDGVYYPKPNNNQVATSNVSFIGEDYRTTSFRNTLPQVYIKSSRGETHPLEGNMPDALTIKSGVKGTYFQGVTVRSDMKDATGRNAALKDYGDKTVFKDAALWGYQDTYVSNNGSGRFYFDGGLLRGATDFLCGSGDVYYNGVELRMCGGLTTAPSSPKQYGYVFRNCRITGPASLDGNYALGRPWGNGTPCAIYIDTEMEIVPSTLGWNEMGTGWPKRFAEYNSHKTDGTTVSLSGRKKTFASSHTNDPVLTETEAAAYTLEAVMGSTDNWDPTALTRQCEAPALVTLEGNTLRWEAVSDAIGYAICHCDTVMSFTKGTSVTLDTPDADSTYTVRAANAMGGLGPQSAPAKHATGIERLTTGCAAPWESPAYDLQGRLLSRHTSGLAICAGKLCFR